MAACHHQTSRRRSRDRTQALVLQGHASRIPELVELAHKVRRHEAGIRQALSLKLNNARIEAANNEIKLIIRKAYGFREVKNLIDMVMLVCSNLRIPLEHREGRDGKKRSGHL